MVCTRFRVASRCVRGSTAPQIEDVAGLCYWKNGKVEVNAAAELIEPYIPDNAVLFTAGAYISYANSVLAGITVFYDG